MTCVVLPHLTAEISYKFRLKDFWGANSLHAVNGL